MKPKTKVNTAKTENFLVDHTFTLINLCLENSETLTCLGSSFVLYS